MTHPTPTGLNEIIEDRFKTLENYCNLAWAGKMDADAREFCRRAHICRDQIKEDIARLSATPMPSSEVKEAIKALEELAGYCVKGRRVDKLFDIIRTALSKGKDQ